MCLQKCGCGCSRVRKGKPCFVTAGPNFNIMVELHCSRVQTDALDSPDAEIGRSENFLGFLLVAHDLFVWTISRFVETGPKNIGTNAVLSAEAISYAVGFVSRKRPFSTVAQIGLSYAVEKGLFRLNFFRLRIPTGGSSRKTRLFRLDPPDEKLSRKSLTRGFEPIASLIPPPNTHPHGHTATHPYQVPHCSTIQGADAGLAIPAVASRSKSAWRIPSFARQQHVSHDGSSARSRSHAANNGCGCCSFGGSRLSATPRT